MPLKEPVSDFEIETHGDIMRQTWINSRYEFLRGHNGIRPKSLMGLISNTGAGKTTLLKCIIAETAGQVKVLVWLSEETIVEYQKLIRDIDKSCLKNIKFVQEREIPAEYKEDQGRFLEYFEQMVDESECDIVFVDNITTSIFYNMRFGFHGQARAAEFLINFVKTKCSIFYIAHTQKDITDNYNKVVTPENIRGSKELPMMTEYFYIIQKFTSNERIFNILRVAKYRHHKEAAGYFALVFEGDAYTRDRRVPFEMINHIFKSRDYLGRKTKKKEITQHDVNVATGQENKGPLI